MFNSSINPLRNNRSARNSIVPWTRSSSPHSIPPPTLCSTLNKPDTYSGLRRWTPDLELIGYIVNTQNKAVLLLFDQNLEWIAFAVDNHRQGYNIFDLTGEWKGYLLKNAAGGLNEFNLEGEWVAFIM